MTGTSFGPDDTLLSVRDFAAKDSRLNRQYVYAHSFLCLQMPMCVYLYIFVNVMYEGTYYIHTYIYILVQQIHIPEAASMAVYCCTVLDYTRLSSFPCVYIFPRPTPLYCSCMCNAIYVLMNVYVYAFALGFLNDLAEYNPYYRLRLCPEGRDPKRKP